MELNYSDCCTYELCDWGETVNIIRECVKSLLFYYNKLFLIIPNLCSPHANGLSPIYPRYNNSGKCVFFLKLYVILDFHISI